MKKEDDAKAVGCGLVVGGNKPSFLTYCMKKEDDAKAVGCGFVVGGKQT